MLLVDIKATENSKSSLFLTKEEFKELYPNKVNSRINYIFSHSQPQEVITGEAKLLMKKYDVVLDLNRQEQLFYTYVSGVMGAAVSIGFAKSFADKVYNIQIANSETNPKISYENLLNCLKMLQDY